jgi:hypothetical protein
MSLAGIETTNFKAHSARGVSTSKTIRSGVSVHDTLKWLISLILEHFSILLQVNR